MELGLSGLVSGFDWRSLVDQLTEIERHPQVRLRQEQTLLQQRNLAYGSIKTQLGVLASRVAALKEASLFDARKAQSGDTGILTATASPGAALGTYTFAVTQMAAASRFTGAVNAGSRLNNNNNVSNLVIANAGFATEVTAGVFTVNGAQVTISASDTLQQVFDKISTATGGVVSGSYSASTDKITLTATGTTLITLGSAADTSNFLQAARLNNNGTKTVVSAIELGGIRVGKTLSSANFANAISDGGSGQGQFRINGVAINFNASTDTVQSVLERINNSAAGVLASYDPVNDQFTLTNRETGDLGVSVVDVTGNFAVATRLSTGTLTRGKDLLYTLNGGPTLTSRSNTITAESSGVAHLAVTALKPGTTTVTVHSDTASLRTALLDLVAEYNRVQSVIDAQTASSTDEKGKVTAGILAHDSEASELAARLRSLIFSGVSGLSGVIDHLNDLGYDSNGNDHGLTLSDSARLDAVLASHVGSLKEFFTHPSAGLATRLDGFLTRTIGEGGTLVARQDFLSKQAAGIDTQIADLERQVASNRAALLERFLAMETAQARINQQMMFLQQRFGPGAGKA